MPPSDTIISVTKLIYNNPKDLYWPYPDATTLKTPHRSPPRKTFVNRNSLVHLLTYVWPTKSFCFLIFPEEMTGLQLYQKRTIPSFIQQPVWALKLHACST